MSINAQADWAFFSSTFSTSSTSYVDLKDGSAGANVEVTLTKGAGTDVLVMGDVGATQNSANATLTLGVNDGTSDHYLAEQRIFASQRMNCAGSVLISGLAAGTYTFKLRVKLDVANQCNFTTAVSASIMAMEVS